MGDLRFSCRRAWTVPGISNQHNETRRYFRRNSSPPLQCSPTPHSKIIFTFDLPALAAGVKCAFAAACACLCLGLLLWEQFPAQPSSAAHWFFAEDLTKYSHSRQILHARPHSFSVFKLFQLNNYVSFHVSFLPLFVLRSHFFILLLPARHL